MLVLNTELLCHHVLQFHGSHSPFTVDSLHLSAFVKATSTICVEDAFALFSPTPSLRLTISSGHCNVSKLEQLGRNII